MTIRAIGRSRFDQYVRDIANGYSAEGYEVTIEPRPDDLPESIRAIHPDLIARKGDECLVIEIRDPRKVRRIDYWQQAKKTVEAIPRWHYILVIPGEGEDLLDETEVSSVKIDRLVGETEALLKSKHINAALLTSWIAFELALKSVAERHGIPTQVPSVSTLLAALYDEGEFDPEDYLRLRTVLNLRNKVVHGQQVTPVSKDDVNAVVSKVKELMAV